VQTGEGALPGFGPHTAVGYAAYHRNYSYYDTSGNIQSANAEPITNWVGAGESANPCTGNCVYDWANTGAGAGAESSTWTNWFYHFDTKRLFIVIE
jgi:hypothetical protein